MPQVVILAAGNSSRFFPFNIHHKSLHIIAGKPILTYTLESVKASGIKEVVIVVRNKEASRIINKYKPSELIIEYVYQSSAKGAGDAILKASKKIKSDFFVINTQHYNFHEIAPSLTSAFSINKPTAVVAYKKTANPSLYGILEIKNGFAKSLVEKPKPGTERSNKRIVGIYLFSNNFLKILKNTPKSEYQLEKAIDDATSLKVAAVKIKEALPTLKYPWHLLSIKDNILKKLKPQISKSAFVAPTATIKGKVVIESGAKIYDYSIIQGPAYIGKRAVVGSYSQIRGGSILEEGAQVQRYCDIKNSQISKESSVHSGFVGDSVIGSNVDIGADFITANKRLDRGIAHSYVKGERISTGTNSLGVFIGNNTKIGIRVSTMPGSIIAPYSTVNPSETIKGTISPILLIDLDNVLFNTELFKRNQLQYSNKSQNNKYLYKDAIKFLKHVSKTTSLILFSEGEKVFQMEKIKNTKLKNITWHDTLIYKPFTKISSLKSASWIKNVVYLIDDNPDIVDKANWLGVNTIRIKRGKYRKLNTKHKPTATVTSLTQIINRRLV